MEDEGGEETALIGRGLCYLWMCFGVIVTSFVLFMLKTLEKDVPGLQSGYTYDDRMAAHPAETSKQRYEK